VRPGDKSLPDQAEEGLAIYGIPVSPVRISQRAAFVHSLTAGQTVNEYEPAGAAAEIRRLFTLSYKQDKKITGNHERKERLTHKKAISCQGAAADGSRQAQPYRDHAQAAGGRNPATTSAAEQGREKPLIEYYSPECIKQFKQITLDHDTTQQDLLAEAINDLFEKYGKAPIA
jgi:hypothetical protein